MTIWVAWPTEFAFGSLVSQAVVGEQEDWARVIAKEEFYDAENRVYRFLDARADLCF